MRSTCSAAGRRASARTRSPRATGQIAFTLAGGLWTVHLEGGPAQQLPTERPVADPRPDPTGRRIAYVSAGVLRVVDVDGMGDRTIAAPDGPEVTYGVGELSDRGFWWAPDGIGLLVLRVDPAGVEQRYLADLAEPTQVPPTVRYAAAGKANAEVTLWMLGLGGSRTQVRWDRHAFEYVVAGGWDSHGPYAAVQSRNQRTVRFLGVEPSGRTTVLSEQRDDCWVQLIPQLPARTASGALVGHADLRGTRHLTVDGVAVTPAGVQVRSVLGIEDETVLFTASEEPIETHLWSYQPGKGARRLSTEPGLHSGVGRGGTLVRVARRLDLPGGRATVVRDGKAAGQITSLVERPALELHATSLVLGPSELRAVLSGRPGTEPASGCRSCSTRTAAGAISGSPLSWSGGRWWRSGSRSGVSRC
ncbi:DPP IV N-terminal domain-containing protein [Fodinicola feengrottensis]|uniref:DPP IV N-terminal domain-containing protein n=1 Tax=Fodinicola feengrottensis TaxID=435914 RepID=UPI0024424008|nr:DPP IV N-terminal domain-containing protein [Fodinicola feengrottensis]